MSKHTATKAAAKPFILDLGKSQAAFKLSLDKAGVPADIRAELIVVMDVSSSFEHEHEEGTTNTLLRRFVPLAKILDPDGQIDVITFSDGEHRVQHVGTIHEGNVDGFMEDRVIDKVRGWNGGTTYSYALEEALRQFGWLPCTHDHQPAAKPRFWNWVLGNTGSDKGHALPHMHQQKRSIVLFVTDGENDPGDGAGDKARTMQVLQASETRGDHVYFLFIGACEHQKFEFVEKIADKYKNTGIVMATDPEAFVELPDDELIGKLLVPELVDWLKS
jgi:hypothetical protein